MSVYEVFIRRPVATTLLTIGIALSGLIAVRLLPVAPLPTVDFPTIAVSASLPGASPETMAATVAMPLERSLGTIAGVSEITSRSSLGQTRVTLQFDLERDINSAAREVQAAINASRNALPSGMPSMPTYRKVNPADAPVMILQMTSALVGRAQMYDLASTVLAQRISQIEGVGQVELGGSSLPAVRVQINPQAVDKLGIGPEAIRSVIVANNVNRPKGTLQGEDRQWQIGANDQARLASDYASLVVAYRNGAPVRLSDVAEVVDSVENVRNVGVADGKPAVLLFIRKQPGANIIETVERVQALMPLLRASIPASIELSVSMERTSTIRASILEAERTLLIAIVLVVAVVFVFLRSLRATLVPAVVVPVSLMGTFGIMYLAGYSLDNLSLMALTVATGFVVDDAVVVLENIIRHLEKGASPMRAAIDGVREVGFTVVTISVSLVAVFIPILAMGGIVGRVLREFSVTLAAAIGISLLISLTTTPMMCAVLLRAAPPGDAPRRGFGARLGARVERAYDAVLAGYRASLVWALAHSRLMLLVLAATIGFNVYLYIAIPKGFLPRQDTGRLVGYVSGDESSSFQSTQDKLERYVALLRDDPAIDGVVGFVGNWQINRAAVYVSLKPLPGRTETADQVIDRLRVKLGGVAGSRIFFYPVQDFRAGGRGSGSEYQYTLFSESVEDLRVWEPRLRVELAKLSLIADVNTDAEDKGVQHRLVIDRDAAARVGISQRQVGATLNDLFGQRQVSTIYNPLNQYRVVLEADPAWQQGPAVLERLNLVNGQGQVVPLSSITRMEAVTTPMAVNHDRLFAASTISFNLPDGVALSEATAAIRDTMARIGMPATIHGGFAGTASVFEKSLASQPWLILAALLTIYIVLGILYESLLHPLTILSTLPSAGVGALLALLATKTEFTIIAMIAVVLLIGIVKKNAIMMIDFALVAQRRDGLSPRDAITQACLVRLRPILMTTFAAILGALPLATGLGDGAELRQPLGIAIVGGLALSQLLTLYTTPVVYLYLERLGAWTRRRLRSGDGGSAGASPPRPGAAAAGLLLVVAAALLLAGCTTAGPDHVRPDAPVPAAFRQADPALGSEPPVGWKRAEPGAPAADRSAAPAWSRGFGDAQLDALVAALDAGNQDIAIAQARWRQAQALLDGSRAGLAPTGGVELSASRSRSGAAAVGGRTANAFRGAASVSWEADLWGRVRRSVEASEAGAQAGAEDLAATRLAVQAALVQAYLQLRASDALRRLLETTVQGYEQSLQVSRNRYQAGVAPRSDVTQAETQLRSVQAQVVDVGIGRAQTEHAIAVLLGRPPAALSLAETDRTLQMPVVPLGLPSELLERRPDIAAAERRVAAANAQVGVAQAAFFPSLQLGATLGTQGSVLGDLLSLPNRFWSLGPALAQTLFDGGARDARRAQARAIHDEAVADYRRTVLNAFQEVEDALVALRLLEREAVVQQLAERAATDALEQVTNQYRAGTVSILNLITAQAALLAARRSLVDVRTRQQLAVVQLAKATGGGW